MMQLLNSQYFCRRGFQYKGRQTLGGGFRELVGQGDGFLTAGEAARKWTVVVFP